MVVHPVMLAWGPKQRQAAKEYLLLCQGRGPESPCDLHP
jgi:hypothetical protein